MRVIVIGGGLAGLGAATYFADKGHAVEVLTRATPSRCSRPAIGSAAGRLR
jgi:succinate dehydrogenase/fumarate reductase flavoprotein subunit